MLRCARCENPQEPELFIGEGWKKISKIPWCAGCYPGFWAKVKGPLTVQDFADVHEKLHPTDTRAQDRILTELALAPPCRCGGCRR